MKITKSEWIEIRVVLFACGWARLCVLQIAKDSPFVSIVLRLLTEKECRVWIRKMTQISHLLPHIDVQ